MLGLHLVVLFSYELHTLWANCPSLLQALDTMVVCESLGFSDCGYYSSVGWLSKGSVDLVPWPAVLGSELLSCRGRLSRQGSLTSHVLLLRV
jgi:hypothetical protein